MISNEAILIVLCTYSFQKSIPNFPITNMWAVLSSVFYLFWIATCTRTVQATLWVGTPQAIALQIFYVSAAVGLWIWAFDERAHPPIYTKW